MSKTQHKGKKPHNIELKHLRENEETTAQAKADLLEQNHFFHPTEEKPQSPQADNENSRKKEPAADKEEVAQVREEPAREPRSEARNEPADIPYGIVNSMISMQENLTSIVETQRRMADMWIETCFSMLKLVAGSSALTVKSEEVPAQRAASLILG